MRPAAVAVGATLVAAACVSTQEPKIFTFQYGLAVYGCDTSCVVPGPTALDSATRGDTVWLYHLVQLVGAVDSVTPQSATLRPDCAVNVVRAMGGDTVGIAGPATCPDSSYTQQFTLSGVTFPPAIDRYTRWVVDSATTPGTYVLIGRVMVQPRITPAFSFPIK